MAVFVLDEFDLFGKAAKQTVLYNLLDALQASNMQARVQPSSFANFLPTNAICSSALILSDSTFKHNQLISPFGKAKIKARKRFEA